MIPGCDSSTLPSVCRDASVTAPPLLSSDWLSGRSRSQRLAGGGLGWPVIGGRWRKELAVGRRG